MNRTKNTSRHSSARKFTTSALFFTVIAIVVGLVASGCNSSANNSNTGTKKTVSDVTIGIPLKNIAALPIWVAQQNGYFANEGLKVQAPILTATTTTTALLSNSVQFISDNASTFLSARAQNSPIVAVSEWDNGQPIALLLGTQFAKTHNITTSTPLVTVMKDMVGSTGGSSSTTTTGQADVLFKSYGLNPTQLKVASFANIAAVETAVEQNSVDWLVTAEPTPLELQAKGYGIVVASSANAAAWQVQTLNQMLVTSNSYASAHPAIVKAFAAAINQATKYINEHVQKAATIAEANLPGISDAIMTKSLSSLKWPTSGAMTTSIWKSTITFNADAGIVPYGTSVTAGVDWTNKYVGT